MKALGLILFAAFAMAQDKEEVVGMVIRIQGQWTDGSISVGQSYGVTRGSRLVVKSTEGQPSITIRFFYPSNVADCKSLDCTKPIDISKIVKVAENPSKWTFAMRAFGTVLADTLSPGDSKQSFAGYARALSRPVDNVKLADAVVSPNDLSPVFVNVPPGDHWIDLCAISGSGKAKCEGAPKPLRVEWRDGRLTVAGVVNPGLQELFYCTKSDGRVTRITSAIVLIAKNEASAEKLRNEYREFSAMVADWNQDESSMLRHAYMQALFLRESK